jgi:hypothetical protein
MPAPAGFLINDGSEGSLLTTSVTSACDELSSLSMEEKIHKGIFLSFSKITTESLFVLSNINLPGSMN